MPSSSVRLASSSTTSTRTGDPSSRWSRAAAGLVFWVMVPVKPQVLCRDQYLPVRRLWSPCSPVPARRWLGHSARTAGGSSVAPMSNDSTPPAAAEQPQPELPQFDPNAPASQPASGATQRLSPVAATTELPVTPPTAPYAYAVSPGGSAPIAGPDVPLSPTGLPAREKSAAGTGDGPRWSAKKTAVTAGLALVLASAGAIGA